MSTWTLYWIIKLDSLIGLSRVIFVSILVVFIVLGIIVAVEYGEDRTTRVLEVTKKVIKRYLAPICVLCILLSTFLPTTKQFLSIISVSYVTQNEKVVTTADKIFDVLDKYLDNKLEKITD